MTEANIKLSRPALVAAAAMCISTDSTRYYLNGVYLEPRDAGGLFIVSTDGHRMFVAVDREGSIDGPAGGAILACEKRDWAAFAKAESATITGPVSAPMVETSAIKASDCRRFGAGFIDGSFPDWTRVLPASIDGDGATAARFNAGYLGDFAKVRKILNGGADIGLAGQDATSPHFVDLDDPDAFGVLMPVRGRSMTEAPAWVSEKPEPRAAV